MRGNIWLRRIAWFMALWLAGCFAIFV